LIDVVHFGAAVSILVSQHLRAGPVGGWPTWVLLSGYMFASCFRLARFNLAAHAIDKRETVGLTISTSGAFLTMAVLAHLKLTQPSGSDWVLLPMLAGVSLLMVSRVAFPDLKGLPRYRVPTILTFLLGGLVAVWLSLEVGLFTIWAIYVGFGTFRAALRRVTRRTTPLDSRQESVNQRSSA
jgi:phosphatidylserine synthase